MVQQLPDSPSETDETVARFFAALADRTRLTIVRALAAGDLRAGEIAAQLALPQNALSYHLKQLRGVGLLRDRRSSADGRDIYYSIDHERLATLHRLADAALSPTSLLNRSDAATVASDGSGLRILFLCTHNSARSQFAEALARRGGGVAVDARSAGDTPTGLHSLTAALLAEWGIDPAGQSSKSVETFAGQPFDYVITVCDRVREHCPNFPGPARQLHWSIPDPTAAPDAERTAAFRAVRHEIAVRVRHFLRAHGLDSGPLNTRAA
jgi:protein-tyrosine-phosphatase/DNA-binding transcriptional ArsR family regulator